MMENADKDDPISEEDAFDLTLEQLEDSLPYYTLKGCKEVVGDIDYWVALIKIWSYNYSIIKLRKGIMISYEEFEDFIKKFYLQSLKELDDMDKEDEERCCKDDRESIMLNTEENVMGNVNDIIENKSSEEIDKVLG